MENSTCWKINENEIDAPIQQQQQQREEVPFKCDCGEQQLGNWQIVELQKELAMNKVEMDKLQRENSELQQENAELASELSATRVELSRFRKRFGADLEAIDWRRLKKWQEEMNVRRQMAREMAKKVAKFVKKIISC